MKRLIVIIGILISFQGFAQITDITDGEGVLSATNKINSVFDYVNDSIVTFNDSTVVFVTPTQLNAIDAMVYPGAGIAVSTGTAWGTSITDNSTNWNTAYSWGDHSIAGYLTGNETITLSGPVTGSGTTAITTSISTGVVGSNELASTTVTAGSYTNADITVDADGRVTAASNGSASGSSNVIDDAVAAATSGGTAETIDVSTNGSSDVITLTGNITLNLHNVGIGNEGQILVRQDATGSRTVTIAAYSDAGTTGLTEKYFSVDEVDGTASYYTVIKYKRFGTIIKIEMEWIGS